MHCIHQASASSQGICNVNPAINDSIFGDLMSDNTSTYTFNEAEFESRIVAVVSHLTSNKHSGINIDNLTIRLGVGRATGIRTLEATTQQLLSKYNFSIGGSCLRYIHDRLN